MMEQDQALSTEVLVIGAGPGGYVAAIRAAQLGQKVTLVEEEAVGGTCLNHGCVPTKTLLAATGKVEMLKRSAQFGLQVGEVTVDFSKMMGYKDKVVAQLVKGIEYLLDKNQVQIVRGHAQFTGPHEVLISGNGNQYQISAAKIIIATGSVPIIIPGLEPNGREIITSKEALALQEIPQSLTIIGAGVVGLEIATIYRQLGSQVTIVEMLEELLPTEDREIATICARALKKMGIKVHLGCKVTGAEILPDKGVQLSFTDQKKGTTDTLLAERVLVAVGRHPNVKGLGLDAAGVATTSHGAIQVNNHLETSVPGIYAIGDVIGGKLLAHKASKEGTVAAERIAGLDVEMDYRVLPGCIFTHPEIASLGLTEHEAQKQGFVTKVGRFPFRASGRAQAMGEIDGLLKIVVEAEHGEILGVHIIGPQADNLIAEAGMAMAMNATAQDLADVIHVHPTLSEVIMEAALNVNGQAIHVLNQ